MRGLRMAGRLAVSAIRYESVHDARAASLFLRDTANTDIIEVDGTALQSIKSDGHLVDLARLTGGHDKGVKTFRTRSASSDRGLPPY